MWMHVFIAFRFFLSKSKDNIFYPMFAIRIKVLQQMIPFRLNVQFWVIKKKLDSSNTEKGIHPAPVCIEACFGKWE